KDYVKKFRTTPEDRVRIDLSQWKLSGTRASTRDPLTLTLPKIIDHRSLQRFLSVTDDQANPIKGKIAVGTNEKTWTFIPDQPWRIGAHYLTIDGQLEDVAG